MAYILEAICRVSCKVFVQNKECAVVVFMKAKVCVPYVQFAYHHSGVQGASHNLNQSFAKEWCIFSIEQHSWWLLAELHILLLILNNVGKQRRSIS